MIEFKGSHFERDVILWAIRWYVAYPISYRQLEEMKEEHGVEVGHATLNRWVLKYVPLLDQAFRARKRPVGPSWRLDETYVRVKGSWKYLYRAVDKAGATVDFLLTAKRDRKAALRFLRKAIKWNGTPEKITIDKSGANTAALEGHNAETEAGIEIRQIKYLTDVFDKTFLAWLRYFLLARVTAWSRAGIRMQARHAPPNLRVSCLRHPCALPVASSASWQRSGCMRARPGRARLARAPEPPGCCRRERALGVLWQRGGRRQVPPSAA